jgi:hypothetical protein
MATKQEKAVQRAIKREKKQSKIRGEKHVLWLLVALILFLLYLLFAQHYDWWPYARPNLGTAFYTNISATAPTPGLSTSGSAGSSGNAGTTGSQGSSGSSGSGTTSTTPSGSPSIAGFSAGVNVGDTKGQTSAQATGLKQNCAVIASANVSTGGQQEVCTYTQGNKIVTVTYLNDRVISASKSGF